MMEITVPMVSQLGRGCRRFGPKEDRDPDADEQHADGPPRDVPHLRGGSATGNRAPRGRPVHRSPTATRSAPGRQAGPGR